jgi:hypothetical protein
MSTDANLIETIARALYATDSVKQAAELAGMSRTTFRRHRDANAAAIDALLAQYVAPAETAEAVADDESDKLTDDEIEAIKGVTLTEVPAPDVIPMILEPAAGKPADCDYQPVEGDPAIRVCVTHDPEFGLYGDELCAAEHVDAAVESFADHQPAAPAPKPAAPAKSGSPAAKKRLVAAKLLALAGELAENWDDNMLGENAVDVTADEARTFLSAWMNYLPGSEWDARLGERSGAGRRSK